MNVDDLTVDIAQEIEVASAGFAGTRDEFQVPISHPDHQPTGGEIIRRLPNQCSIQAEFTHSIDLSVLQFLLAPRASDAEFRVGKPDQFRRAEGAGTLQSQQHTDRFQQGGLALGIVADKHR